MTHECNIGEEEYLDSNDDSMIMTIRFNQIYNSSHKVIEVRRYMDTNIRLNTGYTCSLFKSDKMLLNIRVSEHT